jgi:hypothetical protein
VAGEFVQGVACVKCAPGTYSDEENASECTECAAQHISTVGGAQECETCANGQFQKNTGKTKCHDCPSVNNCVGQVTCETPKTAHCHACKEGFYPSSDYRKCKPCPAAEHCAEGESVCFHKNGEEGQGTYDGDGRLIETTRGDDRDRSTCKRCIPGFYVDTDGLCLKCQTLPKCVERMEVCTTYGDSTCLECKAGWKGDTCEESALDTECFDQDFKYGSDGGLGITLSTGKTTTAPSNDGTTHPMKEHTFYGCQLECRKDTSCELFSFDTNTDTCILHAVDAGCENEDPEAAAACAKHRSGHQYG